MLDGDVIDVYAELICVTRFQGNAQKIQKFWQKIVVRSRRFLLYEALQQIGIWI